MVAYWLKSAFPTFQLKCSFQLLNNSLAGINQAFSAGTKEYLEQVNRSLEQHFGRMEKSFDERVRKLENVAAQDCTSAIAANSADLKKTTQEALQESMQRFYTDIMRNMDNELSTKLGNIVREELREQQGVMYESLVQAVRSGIATPGGPNLAHQQRVQQAYTEVNAALGKSDYNTAFRIALSASDLGLVLFVCEKVNLEEVSSAL